MEREGIVQSKENHTLVAQRESHSGSAKRITLWKCKENHTLVVQRESHSGSAKRITLW